MATIKFLIQSESNPAQIYVRFTNGRYIDVKCKTNLLINPTEWSKAKGQPKNLKDAYYKKLNSQLEKLSIELLQYFNDKENDEVIDTDWLKRFINPKIESQIPNTLVEYFEYYKKNKLNELKPSRIKNINIVINRIKKMQVSECKTFLIKDVNIDFKQRLENFMNNEKYSLNSIMATIKLIKTICNHARLKGVKTDLELESIKLKQPNIVKIYLDFDELKSIEKAEIAQEYLDNARDWLLISCETGQRVSDFMRFTSNMIRFENNLKENEKHYLILLKSKQIK